MEKIIEQVNSWEILSKLPKELEAFTLSMNLEKRDTQYWIFTYENQEYHKSFSVMYDHATKEFLAKMVIGLTEYFDVNFIVADMKILEKLLIKRLRDTLKNLAVFNPERLDSILVDKKVMEWQYGKELPENILGFTLFIKPWQPVKVINGSYIIIDYSDFSNESNFVIYYNIFRDEFFGEVRIRRTPQMLTTLDGNHLEELQEKLDIHLTAIIKDMRHQLDKESSSD